MGVQAEVYPLIKIQPPLSRRGIGPGLIIVSGRNLQDSLADNAVTQTLDPQPRKKWAEEGYTVADVRVDNVLSPQRAYEIKQQLVEAVERLGQVKEYQGEEVGLVVFHEEFVSPYLIQGLKDVPQIKAAVFYGSWKLVFDTILIKIDDNLTLKKLVTPSTNVLTQEDAAPEPLHVVC